jgi:hypothetical protein
MYLPNLSAEVAVAVVTNTTKAGVAVQVDLLKDGCQQAMLQLLEQVAAAQLLVEQQPFQHLVQVAVEVEVQVDMLV